VLKRLAASPAAAVLLDEEGAQARVGIFRERRHPALCPFEGRIILAVLPTQLGDLEKAVAAREVPFFHCDPIGEASRALREGLHDPRDSKAAAVALVGILAGSELRHLRPRLLG